MFENVDTRDEIECSRWQCVCLQIALNLFLEPRVVRELFGVDIDTNDFLFKGQIDVGSRAAACLENNCLLREGGIAYENLHGFRDNCGVSHLWQNLYLLPSRLSSLF